MPKVGKLLTLVILVAITHLTSFASTSSKAYASEIVAGLKLGDRFSKVLSLYGKNFASGCELYPDDECCINDDACVDAAPVDMYYFNDPISNASLAIWSIDNEVSSIALSSHSVKCKNCLAQKPFKNSKTRKGIKLGDSKENVIKVYGIPWEWDYKIVKGKQKSFKRNLSKREIKDADILKYELTSQSCIDFVFQDNKISEIILSDCAG